MLTLPTQPQSAQLSGAVAAAVQVVSYIYFTRIIVFLLGSTLPWRQAWATTVATQVRPPSLCRGTLPFVRTLPLVRSRIALCCDGQQLATFLFYSVTAYKFRPMSANPYLRISQEDEEELRQLVRRSPTRPYPLEPSFFLNLEHSPLTCSWTFGGAGNGADRDGARDKRPVMRALPSVCCVGAVNSFF